MKFIFICLILLLRCSDEPGAARAVGGTNPTGSADGAAKSIAGDWSGVMQAKDGVALSGSPIAATLSLELDKSFILKASDTAQANGKYELFGDNVTVFFNIDKSTISNFGASGSRQSLTYQWLGSDMSLKSSSIDLKLKKQSGRADSGSTATGSSKTYVGLWNCSETSDRNWLLDIKKDQITGSITDGKSPTMNFTGSVTYDNSDLQRALVRITASNSTSSIGYAFRVLRADDKTLKMGKLPSGQTSELSVLTWVECKIK